VRHVTWITYVSWTRRLVYSAWSEVRRLSFKHDRFVPGDKVGLDVYHRLLWANRYLYCSTIPWFSRVGTGVHINTLILIITDPKKTIYLQYSSHTHTHTHTHIYIYIYTWKSTHNHRTRLSRVQRLIWTKTVVLIPLQRRDYLLPYVINIYM